MTKFKAAVNCVCKDQYAYIYICKLVRTCTTHHGSDNIYKNKSQLAKIFELDGNHTLDNRG